MRAGESIHRTRLPDAGQSAQRGDRGPKEAIVMGSVGRGAGFPQGPSDSKVGTEQRFFYWVTSMDYFHKLELSTLHLQSN